MTTTPESASVNDDVEALSPTESDPVQLLDGTWVRVSRLRTRETLALVKILAKGAGDVLAETRFSTDMDPAEFLGVFAGSILLSVPDAEDETIDFIRRVVLPADYVDEPHNKAEELSNRQGLVDLYRKLNNPELDDLITILERLITLEGPHLVALGKRVAALLGTSPLAPQKEVKKPSRSRKSSSLSSSEPATD